MNPRRCFLYALTTCVLVSLSGCGPDSGAAVPASPKTWLGIPSMVNQVIEMVHDGTGWLLNKSQVSVAKVGDVRPDASADSETDAYVADYQITVAHGEHTFETTATDIPCDRYGIPTEDSVTRLRDAVEEIKSKMKLLQQ